jgi:hypothetical protein
MKAYYIKKLMSINALRPFAISYRDILSLNHTFLTLWHLVHSFVWMCVCKGGMWACDGILMSESSNSL